MSVLDQIRALRRFTLFRWQSAVHLAWLLLLLVRVIVDWPPAGFENWPSEARQATRDLINGAYWLVCASWLAAALAPLMWIPKDVARFIVRTICGVVLGTCVTAGLIDLADGLLTLPTFPAPGMRAILFTVARVVGIPLAFALLPIAWHLASERLRVLPILRRWFQSGHGATGGFMTGQEIRKYTRPLPRRLG